MAEVTRGKQLKWARNRVFNGKTYHYWGGLLVKSRLSANTIAQQQKNKGKLARVVYVTLPSGDKRYGVWIK